MRKYTHDHAIWLKYPFITAWGKQLRSFDSYIMQQCRLADKDKAPRSAVFKDIDGEWVLFKDIENENIKEDMLNYLNYF